MESTIIQEVISEKTRRLKEIQDTLKKLAKDKRPSGAQFALWQEEKELKEELETLINGKV